MISTTFIMAVVLATPTPAGPANTVLHEQALVFVEGEQAGESWGKLRLVQSVPHSARSPERVWIELVTEDKDTPTVLLQRTPVQIALVNAERLSHSGSFVWDPEYERLWLALSLTIDGGSYTEILMSPMSLDEPRLRFDRINHRAIRFHSTSIQHPRGRFDRVTGFELEPQNDRLRVSVMRENPEPDSSPIEFTVKLNRMSAWLECESGECVPDAEMSGD